MWLELLEVELGRSTSCVSFSLPVHGVGGHAGGRGQVPRAKGHWGGESSRGTLRASQGPLKSRKEVTREKPKH